MATTTVTRSPVQDGHQIAAGWDDTADNLILATGFPAPSVIGIVFDWAPRTNSVGTVLDPPVISGLTLRLTGHPAMVADPGTDVIELWAVPEAAPADYSALLIPFGRSELLIGSATFTWTGVGATFSITASGDNWETVRALYLSSSRWSGRLALSLLNQGAGGPFTFNSLEATGTGPEMVTTETPFFSGLIGPHGPGQRMVRDGRFGMPALNTELVTDGDQKALWVRTTDVDPEDEAATYKPKPGEGSVSDDVPNL